MKRFLILYFIISSFCLADDIDIYFSESATDENIAPNILFIFDNSGSMDNLNSPAYNKDIEYADHDDYGKKGAFDEDKFYLYHKVYGEYVYSGLFVDKNKIENLVCRSYVNNVANGDSFMAYPQIYMKLADEDNKGVYNKGFTPDSVTFYFIGQYKPIFSTVEANGPPRKNTNNLDGKDVFCGDWMGFSKNIYYLNPNSTGVPTTFFANANRHYYYQYVYSTRIGSIKKIMNQVIDKYSNLNFSLMVFNEILGAPKSNYDAYKNDIDYEFGGRVLSHKKDMSNTAQKEEFRTKINKMNPKYATPLATTLYEALLYLKGEKVFTGSPDSEMAFDAPSVDESMTTATITTTNSDGTNTTETTYTYKSPIDHVCHKSTFVVMLTDGNPFRDLAVDNAFTEYLTSLGIEKNKGKGVFQKEFNTITDGLIKAATDGDDVCTYDLDGSDASVFNPNDSSVEGISSCLNEVAYLIANTDLRDDKVLTKGSDSSGLVQSAKVYTIGFGSGVSAATQLTLKSTAIAGNGKYFKADQEKEVLKAIGDIIAEANKDPDNYKPPALSTKTMNSLSNANYAIMSLFEPSLNTRWRSNLKKVSLMSSKTVVAEDGSKSNKPVTGSFYSCDTKTDLLNVEDKFKKGLSTYWGQLSDSGDITKGGFMGALIRDFGEASSSRIIYTAPASASQLQLDANNRLTATSTPTFVTKEKMNAATDDEKNEIINWYVNGDNGNFYFGDMIHSLPIVVTYDKPGSGVRTGQAAICNNGEKDVFEVLIAGTNNGFIHAINVQTGKELFSYVPEPLLDNLKQYKDNSATYKTRNYGMDGEPVLWISKHKDSASIDKIDKNRDKVFYFQGMRRGGKDVVALDLTNYTIENGKGVTAISPKLAWHIEGGDGDFEKLAQTWSTPRLSKIKWPCTTGSGVCDKVVLFMGGGYDDDQDNLPEKNTTTETVVNTETNKTEEKTVVSYNLGESDVADDEGNIIYMVDAETGDKLWSVSTSAMKNSFPAPLTVVDLNNDGYSNALFAVDVVGRLFRFDFNPEPTGASNFAQGHQIADLSFNNGVNNFARFFNAPDVTKIKNGLLTISIGSGMRFAPNNKDIVDRSYVVFDHSSDPFNFAAYNALATTSKKSEYIDRFYKEKVTEDNGAKQFSLIDDSDLTLKTNFNPLPDADAPYIYGWYRELKYNVVSKYSVEAASKNTGEKILTKTLTFNNCIYFASYLPESDNLCSSTTGKQRAYGYRAIDGASCLIDDDTDQINYKPFIEINLGGISTEPWVKFTNINGKQQISVNVGKEEIDSTSNRKAEPCRGGPRCLPGQVVKEFWRENP